VNAKLQDLEFMRLALALARRGRGRTSPNPMVGAVLTRGGRILGRGWHHFAGGPHAEIEAMGDARRRGSRTRGATLYCTLEPCSTEGLTPACTDAIISAGLRRVVVAATDPNPAHAGRGFGILERAGLEVVHGVLEPEAAALNEVFNHWIVHRRPLVTLKAGMTLDGRIATARGESKWITGPRSREEAMRLRSLNDAVLVGVETVLADDPSLTLRGAAAGLPARKHPLRRIILDSRARTPLSAKVVADEFSAWTTIYATESAPGRRVRALGKRARVVVAPEREGRVDLAWTLDHLGKEKTTSLLVEGGGEVHASFLEAGLAQRVVFFYAPVILGGACARRAVGGAGFPTLALAPKLDQVRWRRLEPDLMLSARVVKAD
jgi:diaminohydroxyphosphoribosylaminopyrimidine deaminase/5-amino-6-(5-phosphoribosylamino)uracil reductase